MIGIGSAVRLVRREHKKEKLAHARAIDALFQDSKLSPLLDPEDGDLPMPEIEKALCSAGAFAYDEGEEDEVGILDQQTEHLLIATAVYRSTQTVRKTVKHSTSPPDSQPMLPARSPAPTSNSRHPVTRNARVPRHSFEARKSRRALRPMLWMAVWCVLGGLLLGSSFFSAVPQADGTSSTTAPTQPIPSPAPQWLEIQAQAKAIQDIRLGNRLAGRNPNREEVELDEPDPSTWRQINLEMRKGSGSALWIELLRPLIWIEERNAQPSCTVYLDLHEVGAVGDARVTYIGPCPNIKPGNGTVVTGRFLHAVDKDSDVLHLRLQGQPDATGVTSNHPYWSEDRQQFVPAGQLREGEPVNTLSGLRRVASITSYTDYTGHLYNLETTEHVYRAGTLGTLVHNAYAPVPRTNPQLVQDIATRADDWGTRQGLPALGARSGTFKHGYADRLLTRYQRMFGNRGLSTEVRYINGQPWRAGIDPVRNSIRLDVVEGPLSNPTAVFDYKFGNAMLTAARINQIRQGAGLGGNVPIIPVNP